MVSASAHRMFLAEWSLALCRRVPRGAWQMEAAGRRYAGLDLDLDLDPDLDLGFDLGFALLA
jgi:hypothetical protein